MRAFYFAHPRAALPCPDTGHTPSTLPGIAKRMAVFNARRDDGLRIRFRKFVSDFVRREFQPISSDVDLDVERWLARTHYTEARKAELREVYKKMVENGTEHPGPVRVEGSVGKVSLFAKDEDYPSYKYSRGIWARSDEAKLLFGPLIKHIEEQVYKSKHFIKKIPVRSRLAYIRELLGDTTNKLVLESDYTSFESHFDLVTKEDCEYILFDYLTCLNPELHERFLTFIETTGRPSMVENRDFAMVIGVKRLSGEMDTSLSNGFFNLCVMLFAAHECGIPMSGPVVEGDDALVVVGRPIPQSFFTSMGLRIKMELRTSIEESSFCGIFGVAGEPAILTDPFPTVLSLFHIHGRYFGFGDDYARKAAELMRSKALSALWNYAGCPIIDPVARRLLVLTSHCIERWDDGWINNSYHREEYLEMRDSGFKVPDIPITSAARELIERKFGISVPLQLEAERELSKITLDRFDCPVFYGMVPELYKQHYETYAVGLQGVPLQSARSVGHFIAFRDHGHTFEHHIPQASSSVLRSLYQQTIKLREYAGLFGKHFETHAEHDISGRHREFCRGPVGKY